VAVEHAFRLTDVGKSYVTYAQPSDRFKQFFRRGKERHLAEFWALKGVSFEIRAGEAVGIIGRNGAGKSTLLQLMCGTLRPSVGQIEATGRVAAMLELGAGFNPEFSGRENVQLAAAVMGLSDRQIVERYSSIVAFAEIGDFIDQPVKYYSSGMYARLAFAVAAHVDADILIVDEILAVGDASFQQKCMRFIEDFKKRGTFLLVSHDPGAVASICDRAIWLEAGSLRAIGPAREIAAQYLATLNPPADRTAAPFQAVAGQEASAGETAGDRPSRPHGPENVIYTGTFDPDAPWFGYQGAVITHLDLLDSTGQLVTKLTGGSEVTLRVFVHAYRPIERALVGFQLRNGDGETILGENTHLAYRDRPFRVEAGQDFETIFDFRLPFLPAGWFSIVAAISDGTQADNIHHHWVDEALHFQVPESHVRRGLVGLPIKRVEVRTRPL